MLLAHADRSRFVDARSPQGRWDAPVKRGTVLHDGLIAGTWHIDRDGDAGHHTLFVHHLKTLHKRALKAIESEATRFVRVHEGTDADHDVRLVPSSR